MSALFKSFQKKQDSPNSIKYNKRAVLLKKPDTPAILQYYGVNISGLEFGAGVIPGVEHVNYYLPRKASIDKWIESGINTIRLPFIWERLQPTLMGAMDTTYLSYIDDAVTYANSRGVHVLLDLHNFMRYPIAFPNSAFGVVTAADATAKITPTNLADIWSKLAYYFRGRNVSYGLMNEPGGIDTYQNYAAIMNPSIAAIRLTGATEPILVHFFRSSVWTPISCPMTADAENYFNSFIDSANNLIYEFHQYYDYNYSGAYNFVDVTDVYVGRMAMLGITAIARKLGKRCFLGEFSAIESTKSYECIERMLQYIKVNSDVWVGATMWGAGGYWGAGYPINIERANYSSYYITLLKLYGKNGAKSLTKEDVRPVSTIKQNNCVYSNNKLVGGYLTPTDTAIGANLSETSYALYPYIKTRVECVFSITSGFTSTIKRILFRGSSLEIGIDATGKPYGFLGTTTITSPNHVKDGQQHLLRFETDFDSGLKLYIDNTLVGSSTTLPTSTLTTGSPFIACGTSLGNQFFDVSNPNATISWIAVYQGENKGDSYTQQLTPPIGDERGLRHNWIFDGNHNGISIGI